MNLILRMLYVIFTSKYRTPLGPLDTSNLAMHVWPTDLDVLMHMNNGRYLSIMDLGRLDLMVRTGFWREARSRGWYPVVGTARVDYRRSLTVFQLFELQTRVVGWDDRWIFLEQKFMTKHEMATQGILKTMIRSKEGLVTPQQVLATVGFSAPSPTLSEPAKQLLSFDEQ